MSRVHMDESGNHRSTSIDPGTVALRSVRRVFRDEWRARGKPYR